MIGRAGAAIAALALAALGTGIASAQAEEGGLRPFQMVRSLQLVQDRIAGGDHAALPMQRKLLELVDGRFRDAQNEDFEDARNFRALMIYAMSGGNPSTVADILARIELKETDREMGAAVLGYLLGDVAQARKALGAIDPSAFPEELAAFLSLVKGSVLAAQDTRAGIALLDRARLLGPGTLVEEAALRRTVLLTASIGDTAKFMSAAEQYARRFLRSPYSSQFAEAFVAGIIQLKERVSTRDIEDTVVWMTPEQARTVYLRLARRAAIDGDEELLVFASRKAKEYPASGDGTDPRSELYDSISSVTSETVDDVLVRLRQLDSANFSATDRALLNAAKAVATEVVAPVGPLPVLPPQEEQVETISPPAEQNETVSPSVETAVAGQDAGIDDELITSARSKLEAIDKMLEENAR